jgi:4-amino-4-deoxy-L-arabinose transferase-like glycosyltransferase
MGAVKKNVMLNGLIKFHRFQKTIVLNGLLLGCLILLIASIVILASVPPVSRDALTHHLAIPKLYLNHGGIYEIPNAKWSYYPMNLDLLYIIPLYFGNDIIPKYIHFAFALLTAVFIFRYLRRRLDNAYALLGAVLFLSLPIIVKLSITVYVDLGLIFFSFAALFYFFKWINHEFKLKFLLISAFWCGMGLGTKYNGLIVLFLLTLFTIFIYARSSVVIDKKQPKAIGFGIVFILVAIIVFSPWAIRNYIWTNNPVYPLYNSRFNDEKAESIEIATDDSPNGATEESNTLVRKNRGNWGHFAVRKIVFKENGWQIALIPLRIFFQGEDDNPKYFDGKLNPLLFFLPIFAFFHIRRDSSKLKTEKGILFAFSILYILYAFFQIDMRIRYIGPVIPALVVLSMLGLKDLTTSVQEHFASNSKAIWLAAVNLAVFFCFCLNIFYLFQQYRIVNPLSFIQGRIERDAYIERYRPEYAAIQFANKNLPDDAKILGIFLGRRGYYCDRTMIFDFGLFKNSVQQSVSAEDLTTILKKSGITHLLVRFDLFNQWAESQFNPREKAIIREFFNNQARRLFSKAGHGLFAL